MSYPDIHSSITWKQIQEEKRWQWRKDVPHPLALGFLRSTLGVRTEGEKEWVYRMSLFLSFTLSTSQSIFYHYLLSLRPGSWRTGIPTLSSLPLESSSFLSLLPSSFHRESLQLLCGHDVMKGMERDRKEKAIHLVISPFPISTYIKS